MSGNPLGRPSTPQSRFLKQLDKKLTDERLADLAEEMIAKAESGDLTALRLVAERLWPATQKHEVAVEEKPPAERDLSNPVEVRNALLELEAANDTPA